MKVDKFGKIEGDEIIKNSNIHPTIKESILDSAESYWNGSYEFESDFMFGFIESLITKGYCDHIRKDFDDDDYDEDEDYAFEGLCYKWCIKYFAKYLPDLKFEITTETPYVLYSPTKSVEYLCRLIDKEFETNSKELNLTTDYTILNKIEGKLYFDEE